MAGARGSMLAAVVAVATCGVPASVETTAPGPLPATTVAAPTSGVVSLETDELLRWAERRYELAGLSMPDVAIHQHDERSGCTGHVAVFVADDPVPEIHLCFGADAPELLRRRVTLHEIAHAWTNEHLTDDDRSDFLERRGLEHWRDPARWFERGTEHAAEIIAWGLLEDDLDVLTIAPNDRAGLRTAFRFLTGVDPICGRTDGPGARLLARAAEASRGRAGATPG